MNASLHSTLAASPRGAEILNILTSQASLTERFDLFKTTALMPGDVITSTDFRYGLELSDGRVLIVGPTDEYDSESDVRAGRNFRVTAAGWGPKADQGHGEIPVLNADRIWVVDAQAVGAENKKIRIFQFNLDRPDAFNPKITVYQKNSAHPSHPAIESAEALLAQAASFTEPLTVGERFTCPQFAQALSYEKTAAPGQLRTIFPGVGKDPGACNADNPEGAAQPFTVVSAKWGEGMAQNRWVVTAESPTERVVFGQYDLRGTKQAELDIQRVV